MYSICQPTYSATIYNKSTELPCFFPNLILLIRRFIKVFRVFVVILAENERVVGRDKKEKKQHVKGMVGEKKGRERKERQRELKRKQRDE